LSNKKPQKKLFYFPISRSIEITDQGLGFVGQTLQKLIFLNYINLQFFCSPKITDKGVKSITQALKKLVSLQTIILNFRECQQVTDDSLKNLNPSLLKTISLDFSYCKITDQGVKNTSQLLNNSLNTIQLKFSQCQEITDESLKDLSKTLSSKTSLQKNQSGLFLL